MEKLIVLADLGRIRSLELRTGSDDPQEKDHLVKHTETALDGQPLARSEVVTDQSGRFGQGAGAGGQGGMSHGEQHNLDTELERKALEYLAERIAELLAENQHPSWILAAPQAILPRLQKALPKPCRDSLSESVGANLTKEPHPKLEQRFVPKS